MRVGVLHWPALMVGIYNHFLSLLSHLPVKLGLEVQVPSAKALGACSQVWCACPEYGLATSLTRDLLESEVCFLLHMGCPGRHVYGNLHLSSPLPFCVQLGCCVVSTQSKVAGISFLMAGRCSRPGHSIKENLNLKYCCVRLLSFQLVYAQNASAGFLDNRKGENLGSHPSL